MDPTAGDGYDEFGLFHENASEHDLPYAGPPSVRRVEVLVEGARRVSALVWGTAPPQLVFLHGGAQNAHTWDTVILALDGAPGGAPGHEVSAVAVDLPGHGHSDWRPAGGYTPANLADDVAVAIAELAPEAHAVIGMSLGGMTAIELAVRHRELVRRLVLVDITPGVNREKAKAVLDFVDGPQSFPNFDSLLARTMEHNPTRTESSLRRGILHNARQLEDGSWQWRYDRSSHARTVTEPSDAEPSDAELSDAELSDAEHPDAEHADAEHADAEHADAEHADAEPAQPLWDDFAAVDCPMLLVRGGVSPVVDDADVAEARRRQPSLAVEVVDGAGHSIQGDRPLELAALVRSYVELR